MVKPLSEDAIANRFVVTEEDSNGVLRKITFKNDKDFNFAYDVIDELAKKCPNKLAMLHISNKKEERRFTFQDISEYSSKTANYFKSLGIRKGDKVMLVLKRHYQYWLCMMALHKLGAVAIPASNLLVEQDYEYRFKAAEVHYIIATDNDQVPDAIDTADKEVHMLKEKIIVGESREGWHNFDEEMEGFSNVFERPQTEEEKTHGDDISVMMFTSGTTIHAKLAAHNFRYPLGHYVTARYWNQVDPDGLHLTVSDTGWAKAMWGKLYGQWLCEAALFVYDFDTFNAKEILQMVEKYHITTFCAPPTMYRVMIRMNLSEFDLSSIQHVSTAGEALNSEVFQQFKKATGHMIYEGYGQTETTMVLGTIYGVLVGLILSFTAMVLKSAVPPRSFLGVIPGKEGFYDLERINDSKAIANTVIYRFSGSLFFGNINIFQEDIEEAIEEDTKVVIVDAGGIAGIDITAADRLEIIHKNLSEKGIQFYITEHIGQLNDEMRKLNIGHLVEEGVARRTIKLALREAGIVQPYPIEGENNTKISKNKALMIKEGILEEFEWAFGEDAEEQMEKHAQEIIENITQITATFTPETDIDFRAKVWRHLGGYDQDRLLEHLERHLNEIAVRLGQPVDAVEANIMEHRVKLAEKMLKENKELYERYTKKRKKNEKILEKENPKLYEYIMEHRRKQYEILKDSKPEIADYIKTWFE